MGRSSCSGLLLLALAASVGRAQTSVPSPEREIRGMLEAPAVAWNPGEVHALVVGRFVLSGGGEIERSGWFSTVWEHRPEGWRVIHDHSS